MKRDTSWNPSEVPISALELNQKRVAIVGGTGGIGRGFAQVLTGRGASVQVVGRTFRDSGNPRIEFILANLESMREAERVGQSLPAEDLDMALLTTGIFAARTRQVTREGLERDLAVSFLSRLVILREIATRLGKNRPHATIKPRIFIWGYPGTGRSGSPGDLNAERSYSMWRVHMNTVVGNELLVLEGAKRYPGVEIFGMSPGILATNIRDNMRKTPGSGGLMEWFISKTNPSPEEYAKRLVPLLFSPDLSGHSGAIFDRKGNPCLPSPRLADARYAQAFLAASEALVTRALQR